MPQVVTPELPKPPAGPAPLRRRRAPVAQPQPSPFRRRVLQYALAFVTFVLVVDALVGDKGLIETMRAKRQYDAVAASLDAVRRENAQLRDEIRRLKEDPGTIESVARQDLGLMRPGEMLFVIKDEDKK